jgi:hypothetical protein
MRERSSNKEGKQKAALFLIPSCCIGGIPYTPTQPEIRSSRLLVTG